MFRKHFISSSCWTDKNQSHIYHKSHPYHHP